MWVTFGKKPELMYLEQFFAFQLQVLMCVRWQGGIEKKDWRKLLPKAPSDHRDNVHTTTLYHIPEHFSHISRPRTA